MTIRRPPSRASRAGRTPAGDFVAASVTQFRYPSGEIRPVREQRFHSPEIPGASAHIARSRIRSNGQISRRARLRLYSGAPEHAANPGNGRPDRRLGGAPYAPFGAPRGATIGREYAPRVLRAHRETRGASRDPSSVIMGQAPNIWTSNTSPLTELRGAEVDHRAGMRDSRNSSVRPISSTRRSLS